MFSILAWRNQGLGRIKNHSRIWSGVAQIRVMPLIRIRWLCIVIYFEGCSRFKVQWSWGSCTKPGEACGITLKTMWDDVSGRNKAAAKPEPSGQQVCVPAGAQAANRTSRSILVRAAYWYKTWKYLSGPSDKLTRLPPMH